MSIEISGKALYSVYKTPVGETGYGNRVYWGSYRASTAEEAVCIMAGEKHEPYLLRKEAKETANLVVSALNRREQYFHISFGKLIGGI